MKHRSVVTLLLASFACHSVAQECPNLGSVPVPERLIAGPASICGIGLEITIGGVSYTSQQGFCPTFVIFQPKHAVPAIRRVGYRYARGPSKDVWKQDYGCYGWIWTACRASGPSRVITTVDSYIDIQCREPVSVLQDS